jgi:hypothetical protein
MYIAVIGGSEAAWSICSPGLVEGVISTGNSESTTWNAPAQPASETVKAADWPPFELNTLFPEFPVYIIKK